MLLRKDEKVPLHCFNPDYEQVKIETSNKSEHDTLGTIVMEFRDTLSTKLSSQPATVTPLTFDLDKYKWNQRRHQQPARKQSLQKEQQR
jgi:hypothetical protein